MSRSRDGDILPLSQRLALMSDEGRQSWWDRRSTQDSIEFWRIPMPERWRLLPNSEKGVRTTCCCAYMGQFGNEPVKCTGTVEYEPGKFRDCGRVVRLKPGGDTVPDELPIPTHGMARIDALASNAYQPEPKEYELGVSE